MSRSCLALIRLGVAVAALLWLVGPAGAEDACLQDAALVAGAAAGDDSGIGGTGFAGDDSGDDSGIGGTGIYGTITNFGSLCVNGLRVRYADDVAVEINGRTAQADRLAVGQVAWAEAFGRGDELSAETISILSAASRQSSPALHLWPIRQETPADASQRSSRSYPGGSPIQR